MRIGWRPGVLRTHRERCGLTLDQVAEAIRNLTAPGFEPPQATFQLVGRHERGVTYPGRRYQRAYAILYDVPEDDLGFRPPAIAPAASSSPRHNLTAAARTPRTDGDPSEVDRSSAWVPSRTITLAAYLTTEDFAVNRREALSAIPVVGISGIHLRPLEQWLLGPGPIASRSTPTKISIGDVEVSQIESAARLFRSWDANFGGDLRRKAVIGQLKEVADLLVHVEHSETTTRRLFAVMAQLAQTAANMAWDSGHGGIAWKYYTLALRAAKEGGDRPFGANILAGMARQMLYLNRPAEALDLIRLAELGSAGFSTPAVRAMLRTREAWAYAKQGRIELFRRATELAECELNESSATSEPYWIKYFDYAELAGVTGGRYLELASADERFADEAASLIERAVKLRREQNLRSTALDSIGLAEARLIQGDIGDAMNLADLALDVVEQTQSIRVRKQVRRLFRSTQSLQDRRVINFQRRAENMFSKYPGLK